MTHLRINLKTVSVNLRPVDYSDMPNTAEEGVQNTHL